MQAKLPLGGSPHWVRLVLFLLTAGTVLALMIVGAAGYRQGRQQATAHSATSLADLRNQLEVRLEAGDLGAAIQIGEYLGTLGVLQDAERRNMQQLRELLAARTQEAADKNSQPLPYPIQLDHELWQAALAAHSQSDWPAAIEHLRELKNVDRKYVTMPYVELLEDVYIRWARSLVFAHSGEEAISLLKVALALRQSELIQRELDAANLLVNSQSSWGVDWPSTLDALSMVYQYDSSYPGLAEILGQAIEQYAEGARYRGSSCEAFLYLSGEQMKTPLANLQKETISTQLRDGCRAATS